MIDYSVVAVTIFITLVIVADIYIIWKTGVERKYSLDRVKMPYMQCSYCNLTSRVSVDTDGCPGCGSNMVSCDIALNNPPSVKCKD